MAWVGLLGRGFCCFWQVAGKPGYVIPVARASTGCGCLTGQMAGEQYSETSLVKVDEHAFKNAGIGKQVTLHRLRHSYATHLLEGGTDFCYIQELLGHKSSRTSEIYTHVGEQAITKIKSPFDDL